LYEEENQPRAAEGFLEAFLVGSPELEDFLEAFLVGSAELEEQRSDEDEKVLQKHRHTRVHGGLAWHHVSLEKNPAGTNKSAEVEHEPHEEPDLDAKASHAALLVGAVAGDLAVGDGVHHEHGDGCHDAARVVGMVHICVVRVGAGRANHDPPPKGKQKTRQDRRQNTSSFFTLNSKPLPQLFAAIIHLE